MLYCSACGAALSDEDIFCPACGALVTNDAGTRTTPLPAPEEKRTATVFSPEPSQADAEPAVAPKDVVFRSTELDCRLSPEPPDEKPHTFWRNFLRFSTPALCVGVAAGIAIGALAIPTADKEQSAAASSGTAATSDASDAQSTDTQVQSTDDSATIVGITPDLSDLQQIWVKWDKNPRIPDDAMFRIISYSTDTTMNLGLTMYTGSVHAYYPDNHTETYDTCFTYENGLMTCYTYEVGKSGEDYLEKQNFQLVLSNDEPLLHRTLTLLADGSDHPVTYSMLVDAVLEFMPGEMPNDEMLRGHIWNRETGSSKLPATLRFAEMNIAYGDNNERRDYYLDTDYQNLLNITGPTGGCETCYITSIFTGTRFSTSSTFGTYLFMLNLESMELTVYSSSEEIS